MLKKFSVLILLLCGTALPSAVAAQENTKELAGKTELISAATFGSLPTLLGPKLSPDGSRLVGKIRIGGELYLAVTPLSHPDEQTKLLRLGEKAEITGWRWVNDDWLVLTVIMEQRYDLRMIKVSRLIGIHRAGEQVNAIAWHKVGAMGADILFVPNDGSTKIKFAAQTGYTKRMQFYPSIFEGDVATGKAKVIVQPYEQVYDWYADHKGNIRLGIGNDWFTGSQRLIYREAGDSGFKQIARSAGDAKDRFVVPQYFFPDRNVALAFSDHDGFTGVYEVNLPDLSVNKEVFKVDGYDVNKFYSNLEGTGANGFGYTDTQFRVKWTDPDMQRIQISLDASFGYGNAHIISWSDDKTKILVKAGGARQPGAYYLYDTTDNGIQLVGYVNSLLKNKSLAPVKTITYTTKDNVEIAAVLTLPEGREAKNLPAIVMPHGGPASRDAEQWDWQAQMLANRGYAVIQPNYRGSTGYGQKFQDMGDGEWGLKMQDDLNEARGWMIDQGIADPDRICMIGGSYGGYAAMRAAQRDGELYRCAISFAGVSDLAAMEDYDRTFLYGRKSGEYLKEKVSDFKAVSPVYHPEDFSTPILLVHGKEDKRVPVSQSRELAEKLEKAGKTFEYVEQEEGDHHFSREEDRVQFLKLMIEFLAEYNPA